MSAIGRLEVSDAHTHKYRLRDECFAVHLSRSDGIGQGCLLGRDFSLESAIAEDRQRAQIRQSAHIFFDTTFAAAVSDADAGAAGANVTPAAAQPIAVTAALIDGAITSPTDLDYYSATIAAGATLDVDSRNRVFTIDVLQTRLTCEFIKVVEEEEILCDNVRNVFGVSDATGG